MKPLTEKERAFLDHLAYEGMLTPPIEKTLAFKWLREHGLRGFDLLNLEVAREKERHGAMFDPPTVPFEIPWESGEEAKRRNEEFAEFAP
jgi:hypothetical protein